MAGGFLKPGARQLADAEKRLAELTAKRDHSQAILAGADGERDAIAAAEHAGEITSEQAAKQFADLNERDRRHRDEVARLDRLVQLAEGEIAGLHRRAADEAYGAALAALREEQAACGEKAARFASGLKSSLANLQRLDQARAAVAEARARALELQPEGADDPEHADELDFIAAADREQLAAGIVAGPAQPVKTGAARSEQASRDRERNTEQTISRAVAEILGSPMKEYRGLVLDQVPEHLRDAVRSRVEAALAKHDGEAASPTPSRESTFVRVR